MSSLSPACRLHRVITLLLIPGGLSPLAKADISSSTSKREAINPLSFTQLQFFHWPCLFPFNIVHMRCLIKVCRVNTNIMSSYPKNVLLTMLPSHATVCSASLCGQASENTALHFPDPLPFWVPALLLLQGVQGATC